MGVRKLSKSRKEVLDAMDTQRHRGTLCDMKIIVRDGHVFSHKAVLAACSPYFHTMFTGRFREGDMPMTEMDMSEVFPSPGTAENIIRSMYKRELDVTRDNVCVLYGICSFLLYDKPRRLCEDFMMENLSLETCIEYWQATYYHTPSGNLHATATDLLKNRFHDYFIEEEGLLNVPQSVLSSILKAGMTKFSRPEQILALLVNWYIKSGLMSIEVLKQLVAEAGLSITSDLEGVCDSLQQSDYLMIKDMCGQLYAGAETHRMPERISLQDMRDRYSNCSDRPKTESSSDLGWENEGQFRKHLKKGKAGSCVEDVEKGRDMLHEHENNVEKEGHVQGLPDGNMSESREGSSEHCNHLFESCLSDAIPSTSPVHETKGHKSDKLLEKAEKQDVLLAIAPSFQSVRDGRNEYQQLRLFAYIPQSQLWVDLGITDYPLDDDGKAINLCDSESRLYATGRNIYLSTGADLFAMYLPSGKWEKVGLPNEENGRRQIFPLCLNDTLHLLIVYDVKDGIELAMAPFKKEPVYVIPSIRLEVQQRLILGKITEAGVWEEILRYKDMNPREYSVPPHSDYGPCWAENSCFFIQKWVSSHLDQSCVLCFDPQNRDITTIQFDADIGVILEANEYTFAQQSLSVHLENWIYLWKKPNIESYSSLPSISVRCHINEDKSNCQMELQEIKFQSINVAEENLHIPSTRFPEFPDYRIFVSTGSRLWCLNSTSLARSSLHEFTDLQNPSVVREHPPPPCNVMLAATGANLDRALLFSKTQARYQFVHNIHHTLTEMLLSRIEENPFSSDNMSSSDQESDFFGYDVE